MKVIPYLWGFVICKPDPSSRYKELYWDSGCTEWADDIFNESILPTRKEAEELMKKLGE